MLRINDYIALVERSAKGYINNQVSLHVILMSVIELRVLCNAQHLIVNANKNIMHVNYLIISVGVIFITQYSEYYLIAVSWRNSRQSSWKSIWSSLRSSSKHSIDSNVVHATI